MSETTKKHTTRRALMGSVGVAALAGIAAVAIAKPDAQAVEVVPVAHNPDGPLLALCARFLELQAAIDVTYDRETEEHEVAQKEGRSSARLMAMEKAHDVEREPWVSEQRTLLEDIGDISATTLPGQRARARVLMAWYSLHRRGAEGAGVAIDWYDLEPLFRDLLGEEV